MCQRTRTLPLPLLALALACSDAPAPLEDAGPAAGADASATPTDDAGSPADAGPPRDAGAAPRWVDTGPIFAPGCETFSAHCASTQDPDCGRCQYRIAYRGDVCTPSAPCPEALVYWSAFGCDESNVALFFTRLAESHPDLVYVCMQPHFPGEILPSSIGSPGREARLFDEVSARLGPSGDLGVWSGARLVFGGCSAGATRYPIVAARFAESAGWRGTEATAVCMSDGVVDVAHQLAFVEGGTGRSCAGRVRRVQTNYARSFPEDCGGGDCMAFDSIVGPGPAGFEFANGVSGDDFAVDRWKLVTEGRSFEAPSTRCERDVVSGAPYEGLCNLLDGTPGTSCTFESYPNAPHCSVYGRDFGAICLDWFRAGP